MCGIVGGYANINSAIEALLHRGPDAQATIQRGDIHFGHTRLAIIDIDERSNQPFIYRDVCLVFNGELWNYQQLKTELIELGHVFQTNGDTEVLAASISQWGIEALKRLDGMFAIAWTIDGKTLYLARDRFGEIPLHIACQKPFFFGSELKALQALNANPKSFSDIPPGHYAVVTSRNIDIKQYYDVSLCASDDEINRAAPVIFDLLNTGTQNRMIADVPICTLLSGGIDSAVIAYSLAQMNPDLVAYTAVYDSNSRDLRAARLVAKHLNIELREIAVKQPSANDLSKVVNIIEMPYKAQIEIGWACLALAEAIRSDGFKVVFSGEGSDELWASYGFAYHALQTQDWHQYRKNLFLTQHRKNFARSNKIFMAHSIECRLPFLHYPFVEYALSLRQYAVQDGRSRPKAVLQNAYRNMLPDEITKRPKVAFQDGMGLKTAIAQALPNPKRFYNAEYKRQFE